MKPWKKLMEFKKHLNKIAVNFDNLRLQKYAISLWKSGIDVVKKEQEMVLQN